MEVRALGTLQVAGNAHLLGPDAFGGRKPKQVLAVLVAARGHAVSKERLVDALWGDQPPQHPIATLENHVWVLRRHLRPVVGDPWPVIVAESGGYRLELAQVDLDLDRFDDLVRRAHGAVGRVALHELEQALALVRGELLEDELYAPWAEPLRRTYETLVRNVRLQVADLALALDEPETAVVQADLVLDGDPLNERACRSRMLGLTGCGDRGLASRTFTSFRRRLGAELGLEPSPETAAVHAAVQRGRQVGTTSLRPPETTPAGRNAELLRASRSAGGHVEPSLAGRSADVLGLRDAIGRVGAHGLDVVLVEGLADVGKTRLVEEALDGIPTGWVTVDRGTRAFPALSLAGALGRAVGATVVTPSSANVEALEAVAAAVRRYAPVVLVLDDLHEDVAGEMVEALAFLQLRCPDVPGVLVGIYRRELVGYGHPIRTITTAARVTVDPLTVAELDPIGGEAAVVRTGGFGAYVAAWMHGDRDGTPDGDLQSRIVARCESAGDLAHRLLRAASVLPAPFTPGTVAAATGVDVRKVAEELDDLTARGLLSERGDAGFEFCCTLVADAVASRVSPARRRILETASPGPGAAPR
jgi:DNA-binding SARP family transcriptional activator